MRFVPKNAEEIAAEQAKFAVWPRGSYDFEIVGAEDGTSKNQNEMIVLDIMVFDQQGNRRNMRDWLVETMPVKLKNACEAVGLHDAYEGGNVAAHDFVGRTGKLTLGIERKAGFDDRNKVAGYIAAPPPAPRAAATKVDYAKASRDAQVSRSLRPAAEARKPVPAGAGGPSWDAKVAAGDLDDEIPF